MTDMTSAKAIEGWQKFQHDHRQFLLTSPEGHAMLHVAQAVIGTLVVEVAQLRDRVDQFEDRNVYYCADRDHETMMAQCSDAMPGSVLRATDTLREWRLVLDADGFGNHGWQEIL